MTIEEIELKLKHLEEILSVANTQMADARLALDELKGKRDEPQPPHPRWQPGCTEKYYYINQSGGIYCNIWYEDEIDTGSHAIGNIFQSEDDAKFAAERQRVLAEMREWEGKWDDPWGISYNWERRLPTVSDRSHLCPGGEMRFATDEDAENCIKAVGADRIIKYYFMVPEDEEETSL